MALPQDRTTIRPILRNAQADLNSGTAVPILAAPPRGTTYLLRRLNGVNSSVGNKLLAGSILSGGNGYRRFLGLGVANGFPFTARLANQPGPHDYFAVLTSDDTNFRIVSSATITDPVQLDYEVVPAGAHDNAKATLEGTTWVTILAAPPRGTTYAIRGPDGLNAAGGTRFLHIAVLKGGSRYYLHTMRGINLANWGYQSEVNMPRNPNFIGSLTADDESLQVSVSGTCTDHVSVDYDIIPQ